MAKTTTKETAAPVAAAEEEAKTAVATQAQGSKELAEFDYGEDAGKGMQDVSRDEFKIPMLRILDPKSPQLKPVQNGGIPGAKAGDIFNTGTNEVYSGTNGLIIIPCHRDHKFIEFIIKNEDGSGGGFVGIREVDDPLVLELREKHGKFGKLPVPGTNHELSETFSLACVVWPIITPAKGDVPAVLGPKFKAVIAFASTQIKKYQSFMTRTMGIQYKVAEDRFVNPPIWGHRWHFKTQYEEKNNRSWYGWVLTMAAKNADGSEAPAIESRIGTKHPDYIDAKDFALMMEEGKMATDFAKGGAPADGDAEPPM